MNRQQRYNHRDVRHHSEFLTEASSGFASFRSARKTFDSDGEEVVDSTDSSSDNKFVQPNRNENNGELCHSRKRNIEFAGVQSSSDNNIDSGFSKKIRTAKEYHRDAKIKQWRLVVRNLPFKITKADVQNICSKFGTFTEIAIPPSKKMPNRAAGFAFIQFNERSAAECAKEYFNSNKIQGRMVAADWAIAKDDYETATHNETETLQTKVKTETEDKTRRKLKAEPEVDTADLNCFKEANEKEEAVNNSLEMRDHKDRTVAVEDGHSENAKVDQAVHEGRVVFLRNLSFDTDEAGLLASMEKYGNVTLAIVCRFKDSQHSKGTAFVHFSNKDEADSCIRDSSSSNLLIDGRLINASIALPRHEAAQIEHDKQTKIPKDKRNLRLLRFGVIREGTSAANGMSTEDATKRVKLAVAAKKKLENLHMFVSPIRLVIHNIPPSMTDSKLKELCRTAGGDSAYVKECRIWKDMKNLTVKGQPKSRGFAFVCFTEHKHALQCLKTLNNAPNVFSNTKRPIVEFSIENLSALQAKERRLRSNVSKKNEGSEKNIEAQVKESIKKVHEAGMKFLPAVLGNKMRHRDLSKAKKKKLGISQVKTSTLKNHKRKSNASSCPAKKVAVKYLTQSIS